MPAGSIAKAELIAPNKVRVTTVPCVVCGKESVFELNRSKYERWQYGEHIQNVFPEMNVGDRERLISGTHDDCFHKLFPPED